MEDVIPSFTTCPRCLALGYDRTEIHAFCVDCNYSPDLARYNEDDQSNVAWAIRMCRKGPLTNVNQPPLAGNA